MPEKKRRTYFRSTPNDTSVESSVKRAEEPSTFVKFFTVFLATVILLDLPVFLWLVWEGGFEKIPGFVYAFMIILPVGMGIAGIFFAQSLLEGLRRSGKFLFEIFFDGITDG